MKVYSGGIGFFDSGIGGLTVLEECRKRFPNERFYYYGDNAHAPYGNRTTEEIFEYVYKAMDIFKALRAKAVVLACNTVTAVCIENLREKYPFPIIGTEPAVRLAAQKGREVFILATAATCASVKFQKLCQKTREEFSGVNLRVFPCYHLAGEIEKNFGIGEYTKYLPVGTPNAVVLGCTHYIYIKRQIEKFYHCPVFDGNAGVAMQLSRVLQEVSPSQIVGEDKNILKRRFLRPFLTTIKQKDKKTNKCSYLYIQKFKHCNHKKNIIFLGETKEVNLFVYKQMFESCSIGQKMFACGQKNKKNKKK